MGIMTRMVRLWKADLHGVMDQLEDKGLLLRQYLREMENSLQQKENCCERLTQSCRQIERDMAHRSEEIHKLDKDLDLAVGKAKDDIARMLIRRRRSLETGSSNLKEQMEVMMLEHTQLSETMEHQRSQYETLSARADTYSRQAGDRLFETASHYQAGPIHAPAPSDEEIELELLTRKEALQKGGTP